MNGPMSDQQIYAEEFERQRPQLVALAPDARLDGRAETRSGGVARAEPRRRRRVFKPRRPADDGRRADSSTRCARRSGKGLHRQLAPGTARQPRRSRRGHEAELATRSALRCSWCSDLAGGRPRSCCTTCSACRSGRRLDPRRSPAASRQLASRARRRAGRENRAEVDRARQRVVEAFLEPARRDFDALRGARSDVVFRVDAGGASFAGASPDRRRRAGGARDPGTRVRFALRPAGDRQRRGRDRRAREAPFVSRAVRSSTDASSRSI
jgi:hypothetical protein